jgi:hypothetical protein
MIPLPDFVREARVLAPDLIRQIWNERAEAGFGRDEIWDVVVVFPPLSDNTHQAILSDLTMACAAAVSRGEGDHVYPGVNVSDREDDWLFNYRCPDVVVYLRDSHAKDCGTHYRGGPDFLVEIVSLGENPREKLAFYAAVNTREVLIVDRYPWSLELYQLQSGRLVLAGRSDPTNPAAIASAVLPLTFRLEAAAPRPLVITTTHSATGRTWYA